MSSHSFALETYANDFIQSIKFSKNEEKKF